MKRYNWIRWIAIASIIVLPILTTGCGLFKSDDAGQSIDPPQEEAAITDVDAEAEGAAGDEVATTQRTLYFKDKNGFVAPISMELAKVEGPARQSLEYLVEGGPSAELLPEGFTGLLPQGTKILGFDIIADKKLAVVDFSGQFTNYNVQDERRILEAITWTLTGFPSIENVELWVEGTALKEMPMDGTPLDEPLSRTMGINIETADGVNLGQSSPVTLYFLNQNSEEYDYYVPVTRMIERTNDVASAVIQELIKGPDQASSLEQVMMPTAELLDVSKTEELIAVNFSDTIMDADNKVPTESLQSVILSLTDSTGASKVQIMIKGDTQINSTDNQSYSTPVARPSAVNPYKM